MSNRKLAHIERVIAIDPIPNADNLEVATILGWKCVVKKNDVKVGDFVAYLEVDSIVPDIPFFEFMKSRKFRVRTIKLRGTISQGLVIPLKDISTIYMQQQHSMICCGVDKKEGDDVTEELGITKYLSPSEREAEYTYTPKKKHNFFIKFMTRFEWYRKLTKTKSKSFPEWISKTDEERIQNMPWIVSNKDPMYVTEKLDGQSATYWIKKKWIGYEYGICSRTIRKFEWDNSNWSKVFKKFNIKKQLQMMRNILGRDIAIQGEIIGSRIQGNKYNIKDFDFYVFNVFDIKRGVYFDLFDAQGLVNLTELKFVPILKQGYLLPDTVDELINMSKGKSMLYDTLREGVVIRSYDKKVSFKVINPDFLLKNEE